MQTVARRYFMILVLLVGLAGLAFFQYASAQYYTKDNSVSDHSMTAKDRSMLGQDSVKDVSMQKMEKMSGHPNSPLIQISQGILPDDVQCREGLQLIFKASNGMPACVKPATAMRLMQIGWAKQEMMGNEKMPAVSVHQIKLNAVEEDETYRWSGEDGVNPTLIIYANTDNQIQIKNPTDAKHEFVIESEGKEVAASGDISADGSGMVTIKPETTGTWEYHCEYHPTTMKGTINIVLP